MEKPVVIAHFIGSDLLVYNDLKFSGTDAVGRLCRELVMAGHEVLEIYRGSQLSLTVNITKRAGRQLSETDTGFFFRKFDPIKHAEGLSRLRSLHTTP